ncbi:hypothetical protein BP6252_09766 [Coleophoma cylindrospora]|uniref:Protein kinase domain-containing protein n=1 Tax=Coleophoma cylindrospora TaxID=1849047 RepID=A0A3D8QWR3_9HELO|nr:hypothetical protein BP6252_09766 [Coleophoma cylindrospora]
MRWLAAIQFIVTAKDLPKDSQYLNLRLRMEQQRLFAWSETSGLLDLDSSDEKKIRESNTFMVHRTTILDLLVQIKCLFEEFEKAQRRNGYLQISPDPIVSDGGFDTDPGKDSSSAHVPLSEKRKNFIIKAMKAVTTNATDSLSEGRRRLAWAAFRKGDFEALLQRFATLNDNMTDILDARLQVEIHRTTEDTNRGVLQLHKNIASLHQLVLALNIKMEAHAFPIMQRSTPANDASGLRLLAQLAKFKAFNESIDAEHEDPGLSKEMASILQLGRPNADKQSIRIDRSSITLLSPSSLGELGSVRSGAVYEHHGKKEMVWIEWKEYDYQGKGAPSPPPLIIDRVQKLAALLHHTPKPEAFRVPHCIGYFDNATRRGSIESVSDSEGDDESEPKIGFVFERPSDDDIASTATPISLLELLTSSSKPRVTERIHVAYAIANCLLYLHSVNWLHKGLRSHNIVFFPTKNNKINYKKPYLSGFDFARPARADEMTEVPGDIPEYNMYRHPSTQGTGFGPRESFRKSFDIYSLGVVLAELAHWTTIDKVLGIQGGKLSATRSIRETLLREGRIQEIGANMGEVYEEATTKCIAGGRALGIWDGADETDDTVAAKLSFHFYEDVVKKLGDVKV